MPLRAIVRRSAAFCARRRFGGVENVRSRKIAQERPCALLRAFALCVRATASCVPGGGAGFCGGFIRVGEWLKENERVPHGRHSFVGACGLSCGAHFARRAPFCSAPVIRGRVAGRTPLGTLPARTPCRAGSCNSRRTARADPHLPALSSPRSCKP